MRQLICPAFLVVFCIFESQTVLVQAVPQEAKSEIHQQESIRQFIGFYDGHAFIHIISYGDNKSQTAMVTVFELIGRENIRIRRLHQMDLVNKCHPNGDFLCGSGRFFLTFDDGAYPWTDITKTENLLVVYDLVRKEKTVLNFKSIFPPGFFEKRGYDLNQDMLSPQDWHQYSDLFTHQQFDAKSQTFRIPLPPPKENAKSTANHEIVVDLLAREATVQEVETYVDLWEEDRIGLRRGWQNSVVNVYNGELQPSRLPKLLKLSKFRGHDLLVFQLDERTGEYQLSSLGEWENESFKGDRCGR